MNVAALILKNRRVAPGVILKIVPATDKIWNKCLQEGLIDIFKKAGALVSNAGCAGCAAGQVGQNGLGEVTISTGNRNFPGKQGKGSVYLASPGIVAASAIAGYITTPDKIPDIPSVFIKPDKPGEIRKTGDKIYPGVRKGDVLEGRIWMVKKDNIDTDMIFHNRYLATTDLKEMGKYTFDNLKGFEDFSIKSKPGDIVVTGKNFGCGSSRQQAVDCFSSLGIQAIIAESFGAIYERNAINAAFPILTCNVISELDLKDGDLLNINLKTGELLNFRNKKSFEVYQRGGLLGK